ncbi:hypothetical protein RhiirA1_470797 [Rhizophagus irregularis]|uniref:DUF8211 domain-containing protein n=1 Tax=Rhizophagus irregularis TaxID=588596 RepID=A0A2N0R5H8_9GLOM|nr:hypothetical protein RhiirA1_470797 [Rhizophagus irregularis]
MSKNRHACGAHQSVFFHNQINNNLKFTPPDELIFINSKSSHANHIFDLWQNRYLQKIFSNRLGIEYTSRFTANGTDFVRRYPTASIYRKHLSDFKLIPSKNPRTRRKQEARFKRQCNRLVLRLPWKALRTNLMPEDVIASFSSGLNTFIK